MRFLPLSSALYIDIIKYPYPLASYQRHGQASLGGHNQGVTSPTNMTKYSLEADCTSPFERRSKWTRAAFPWWSQSKRYGIPTSAISRVVATPHEYFLSSRGGAANVAHFCSLQSLAKNSRLGEGLG